MLKVNKDNTIVHRKTGQPLFKFTPHEWERGGILQWHPHMLEMHPGLKDSHEHGLPEEGRSFHSSASRGSFKTKGDAIAQAENIYNNAARRGFKDTLKSEKWHEDDPEFEGRSMVKHRFYDPDTGDPIVTSTKTFLGDHKSNYHKAYLDKHGIDPDAVKSFKTPRHDYTHPGYQLARHIHSLKGKSYRLIGQYTHEGHSTYKINTSPEEASSVHEEHVKNKYGNDHNFKIKRHSPTHFTASWSKYQKGIRANDEDFDSSKIPHFPESHLISQVSDDGKTLHQFHHTAPESYRYKSRRLDHKIE